MKAAPVFVAFAAITVLASSVLSQGTGPTVLAKKLGSAKLIPRLDGSKLLYANPFSCRAAATTEATWVIALQTPETISTFSLGVVYKEALNGTGTPLMVRVGNSNPKIGGLAANSVCAFPTVTADNIDGTFACEEPLKGSFITITSPDGNNDVCVFSAIVGGPVVAPTPAPGPAFAPAAAISAGSRAERVSSHLPDALRAARGAFAVPAPAPEVPLGNAELLTHAPAPAQQVDQGTVQVSSIPQIPVLQKMQEGPAPAPVIALALAPLAPVTAPLAELAAVEVPAPAPVEGSVQVASIAAEVPVPGPQAAAPVPGTPVLAPVPLAPVPAPQLLAESAVMVPSEATDIAAVPSSVPVEQAPTQAPTQSVRASTQTQTQAASGKSLSSGAIAGIIAGCLAGVAVFAAVAGSIYYNSVKGQSRGLKPYRIPIEF